MPIKSETYALVGEHSVLQLSQHPYNIKSPDVSQIIPKNVYHAALTQGEKCHRAFGDF